MAHDNQLVFEVAASIQLLAGSFESCIQGNLNLPLQSHHIIFGKRNLVNDIVVDTDVAISDLLVQSKRFLLVGSALVENEQHALAKLNISAR